MKAVIVIGLIVFVWYVLFDWLETIFGNDPSTRKHPR
jgi:hypothetical protein